MRIIKIEPDLSVQAMIMNSSSATLVPVTLTFKKFWTGKEVQCKAFPTNYGPTYHSGTIQYYMYTDELGNEFDDDVCKQINNFLRMYFLTHNIN